jgi:hypothetical protein
MDRTLDVAQSSMTNLQYCNCRCKFFIGYESYLKLAQKVSLNGKGSSDNVINWLISSISFCFKVILISGFHCTVDKFTGS